MKLEGFQTNTNESKKQPELTREQFMEKLKDPYWLPKFDEIVGVIDSFTDKEGVKVLDETDQRKWQDFLFDEQSPIFEIWTREYIENFSNYLSERSKALGGTKENPTVILEVGAGDGKLSYFLNKRFQEVKEDTIKYCTTGIDIIGRFEIKSPFNNVENISEKDALKKYKPSIVISSWMNYGEDWTEDFRNTKSVHEYILIGPRGPCGTEETWENSENFKVDYRKDLNKFQLSRLDILDGLRKNYSSDLISLTVLFTQSE